MSYLIEQKEKDQKYFSTQKSSPIPDVTLSQSIQDMLPAVKEILRKISKESSEVVKVAESYNIYIESKMNKSNKTNKELLKMLDMPLGRDGKILTANSNTEMVLNFAEMIQFETIDLIKNIYDLVDLSYDNLLSEVAKIEEKFNDRKFRHFLKSSYIPRYEHEEILSNLEIELRTNLTSNNNKKLKELEFLNEDLRKENLRLKKKCEEKNEDKEKISYYETQLNKIKISTEMENKNLLLEKEGLIGNLLLQIESQEKILKKKKEKEKDDYDSLMNLNKKNLEEISKLKNLNFNLNKKIENFSQENLSNKNKNIDDYKKRIHELEIELLENKKNSQFEIGQYSDTNKILEKKYKNEIENLEAENSKIKKENILLKNNDENFEKELFNKKISAENSQLKNELKIFEEKIKNLEEKNQKLIEEENQKIKNFYEEIISGLKKNLDKEKSNSKKISEEKEKINYQFLEIFGENEKLKNQLATINLENDHKFSLINSELNEHKSTKENILIEIEEERKKLFELSAENVILRKEKNKLEINNLELKNLRIKKGATGATPGAQLLDTNGDHLPPLHSSENLNFSEKEKIF